ncbi:MAG: ABC transporter permease [Planctomycetia bacterium]
MRAAVPGRWRVRPGLLAALLLCSVALLVPVGRMLWASLRVEEVQRKDGSWLRAVGEVREERGVLVFAVQSAPGAERVPVRLRLEDVAARRTVTSLAHHEHVLGDARTRSMLGDSLRLALGATLVALLLGLPQAWALARWQVPGRGLLWALALAPLVLPTFVLGMGAARPVARTLEGWLGLSGSALQVATATLLLGAFLAPVVTLLVGRAWARLPAGPVESALLLGGPRAAWRTAVLPRLLPAAGAAAALVLVLALADFAVIDLMSFLLPGGGTPVAVFSKEVQLQWSQEQNTGRAVATGAPLLLLCVLGLALAAWALRRAPPLADPASGRCLAPRRLALRSLCPWLLALALPLLLGVAVPLAGLASWAGAGGETVAQGSAAGGPAAATPVPAQGAHAQHGLDVAGALERTPGVGRDLERWLKTGVLATLLAMLAAWGLARGAQQGGRVARALALGVGTLALATPGLVVGVGTLLTWSGVGWAEQGVLRPALALAVRCLPVALLGVGLALREARPGQEEAAATLGAGPWARTLHVTLPAAGPGLLASTLVAFVLALRELDAVVLLETGLFPLRLYDKIHYSRMADEASLALLCLTIVLGPLLLLAGLWALRQGLRRRWEGTRHAARP